MATSTAEIDVHATPAEILEIIADLPHYPEWSAVHKRAKIETTDQAGRPARATMAVAAVGLTDQQTLDYTWTTDHVSWTLVSSGQQKRQQGSYTITPGQGDNTHVRYDLTIDPRFPMPGLIVRQVMKKAVTAATEGLKRQVESHHAA